MGALSSEQILTLHVALVSADLGEKRAPLPHDRGAEGWLLTRGGSLAAGLLGLGVLACSGPPSLAPAAPPPAMSQVAATTSPSPSPPPTLLVARSAGGPEEMAAARGAFKKGAPGDTLNPAGSLLVPSSVWVDPSPPPGWTQCAGFINTCADDVTAAVFDNCLSTTRLRVRVWNADGKIVDDNYATGQSAETSWPRFNYLKGTMTFVATTYWGNTTYFTVSHGDACHLDGTTPDLGALTFGSGSGDGMIFAPGHADDNAEIAYNKGCIASSMLDFKMAMYK